MQGINVASQPTALLIPDNELLLQINLDINTPQLYLGKGSSNPSEEIIDISKYADKYVSRKSVEFQNMSKQILIHEDAKNHLVVQNFRRIADRLYKWRSSDSYIDLGKYAVRVYIEFVPSSVIGDGVRFVLTEKRVFGTKVNIMDNSIDKDTLRPLIGLVEKYAQERNIRGLVTLSSFAGFLFQSVALKYPGKYPEISSVTDYDKVRKRIADKFEELPRDKAILISEWDWVQKQSETLPDEQVLETISTYTFGIQQRIAIIVKDNLPHIEDSIHKG